MGLPTQNIDLPLEDGDPNLSVHKVLGLGNAVTDIGTFWAEPEPCRKGKTGQNLVSA